MTKVLVIGGDGYIGWPLSMRLASLDYDVTIMDNLIKRKWEMEMGAEPLFEVFPIHRRVAKFREMTGKEIQYYISDMTNVGAIYHVFDRAQPDVVIHCSGQPSAPFSMKNRANAVLTHQNNVTGILNVLFAVQRAERDIHLISIQGLHKCEGEDNTSSSSFASFYHVADVQCVQNIQFACQNWGMRTTVLQQGIVYGFETDESKLHPYLHIAFHYDEVFGSLVNRFTVQAAIGHPLTVYGEGNQTCALLHIENAISCVERSIQESSIPGSMRTAIQYLETLTINQLAEIVQQQAKNAGYSVEIKSVSNPRKETADGTFPQTTDSSGNLSKDKITVKDALTRDCFHQILQAKDRIDTSVIQQNVLWNRHEHP